MRAAWPMGSRVVRSSRRWPARNLAGLGNSTCRRRRPQIRDSRKGPRPGDARAIARKLTSRRPSPPGIPHRVELALRISFPRTLVERLTAQAIREARRLEQVIIERIERE